MNAKGAHLGILAGLDGASSPYSSVTMGTATAPQT